MPKRKEIAAVQEYNSVSNPSSLYKEMAKKWALPETLRGGTEAMREKGRPYLPQEPKESDAAYNVRLQRTFLYNMYWRTVTSITGLAFIKPVVVSNVPEQLEYLEFDFDGTGRSITEVAYDMAIDCIHYGLTHILTDFPTVQDENMSLAEFRQKGYKPYITHVNPTALIGFRTSQEPGVPNLVNIRIKQSQIAQSIDDEWADKKVEYVIAMYPDRTVTYMRDPELTEGFEFHRESTNTLGKIPLCTAYANKTGYLTAEPALYDLAMINLRHWQSSSDQNNILHIARVPFLLATGFDDGELDNVEIGANRIVTTSSDTADIKHVEHTGQAIGAGRNDLKDIEVQMAALGADLLLSKGVSRMTATARRLDQNESMSVLQMALRSIEQAIEKAYQIAGEWLGVDASAVSVAIGDDLSIANEPNPTNALVALKDSGLLTDEQVVEEAKRQGILSSYFRLSEERPGKIKPPEDNPFETPDENEEEEEGDDSERDNEEEEN